MKPQPRLLAVALATAVLAAPRLTRAEAQGGASPMDDATLIALAVSLAVAPAPEVIEAEPGSAPAPHEPQLELVATVRAKTLVFTEVPSVNVTFTGNGPRHTVWRTERVNLPAQVEPGVTYRDVAVRLTVTSTVPEMAALLGDAKRASRGVQIEADDGPVRTAAARDTPRAAARAPAH